MTPHPASTMTGIDFKSIPVQAGIISNIIALDIDANQCFRDLHDLISTDQGVASLVLRVANSPLYSRGNTVAAIPTAISILRYGVVRSLALIAFSRSLFSHTKNDIFRLHIWQHSLLTGIASQALCHEMGASKLGDEAFMAGLMHDTGKVLMYSHDPARYRVVMGMVLSDTHVSLQAERELFGFDHCQVGLEAVTAWKLPEHFMTYLGTDLATPATQSGRDAVLDSLQAANYLVKASGLGACPVPDAAIRHTALSSFGLPAVVCEHVLQDAFIADLQQSETYLICSQI